MLKLILKKPIASILVLIISIFIIYVGYLTLESSTKAFYQTEFTKEDYALIEKEYSIEIPKTVKIDNLYFENRVLILQLSMSIKEREGFLDYLNFEHEKINDNVWSSVNLDNRHIEVSFPTRKKYENLVILYETPSSSWSKEMRDKINNDITHENYFRHLLGS